MIYYKNPKYKKSRRKKYGFEVVGNKRNCGWRENFTLVDVIRWSTNAMTSVEFGAKVIRPSSIKFPSYESTSLSLSQLSRG
jgi:hypothetical protein